MRGKSGNWRFVKLMSLLLASMLVLTLAACSGSKQKDGQSKETSPYVSQSTSSGGETQGGNDDLLVDDL